MMGASQNVSDKIAGLHIGDTTSMTRVIRSDDVLDMAQISGDFNPIHIDDEYAAKTRFGRRIAHGLFCVGMISALLGTKLPGLGTVLVSEEIKYSSPVYLDDEITASVTVENIDPDKNRVGLSFLCKNQKDKPVVSGSAKVIVT